MSSWLRSITKLTPRQAGGTVGGNRANLITPFGGPGGIFNANRSRASQRHEGQRLLSQSRLYTCVFSYQAERTPRYRAAPQLPAEPARLEPGSTVAAVRNRVGHFHGSSVLIFDNGLTLGQDPYVDLRIGNTFVYSIRSRGVRGTTTGNSARDFPTINKIHSTIILATAASAIRISSGGVGTGNSLAASSWEPRTTCLRAQCGSNIRSKATYAFAQDEWRYDPT